MIDLEEKVRDGLASAAAAVPTSPNSLAEYRRRTRRRPNLTLGLSLAMVTAAVALIVGGAIALSSHGHRSAARQPPGIANPTTFSLAPTQVISAGALAASVAIMRSRIDALNIQGASVTPRNGRGVVTTPVSAASEVEALATTRGVLQIRQALSAGPWAPGATTTLLAHQTRALAQSPVLSEAFVTRFEKWDCSRPPNPAQLGRHEVANSYVIACDPTERTKLLLAPAAVGNSQVATASAANSSTGDWGVLLNFDADGAQAWQQVTAKADAVTAGMPQTTACSPPAGCNIVAMTVDGQVKTAPYISQPGGISGGTAEIVGGLNHRSAMELAAILSEGPLPTSFHVAR